MTGMEINADLFDVDDVAELDSDSDEEEEKGGGSWQGSPKSERGTMPDTVISMINDRYRTLNTRKLC